MRQSCHIFQSFGIVEFPLTLVKEQLLKVGTFSR